MPTKPFSKGLFIGAILSLIMVMGYLSITRLSNPPVEMRIARWIQAGEYYLYKGDNHKAAQRYRSVLAFNPNNEVAEKGYLIATFYGYPSRIRSLEELLKKHEKYQQKWPKNKKIRLYEANLFERQGKYDIAKKQYRNLINDWPDYSEATYQLALLFIRQKDRLNTIKTIEALLLDPSIVLEHVYFGVNKLWEFGEYGTALMVLEKQLEASETSFYEDSLFTVRYLRLLLINKKIKRASNIMNILQAKVTSKNSQQFMNKNKSWCFPDAMKSCLNSVADKMRYLNALSKMLGTLPPVQWNNEVKEAYNTNDSVGILLLKDSQTFHR